MDVVAMGRPARKAGRGTEQGSVVGIVHGIAACGRGVHVKGDLRHSDLVPIDGRCERLLGQVKRITRT
jgi:hypothetical protein